MKSGPTGFRAPLAPRLPRDGLDDAETSLTFWPASLATSPICEDGSGIGSFDFKVSRRVSRTSSVDSAAGRCHAQPLGMATDQPETPARDKPEFVKGQTNTATKVVR